MEHNEEYLLQALRRTSGGLTDSLIPAHGAKLTKLLAKFEKCESVTHQVQTLLHVQGFGKCALTMEWLLERVKRSAEGDAPEQFESDVLLLNEKLFEAFLNQPFDMPDYSRTFEAPVRPIQQNIQVSDDEFLGTNYSDHGSSDQVSSDQATEPEALHESIAQPDWNTSSSSISYGTTPASTSFAVAQKESTPSLREAMNADLFDATERISQTAIDFSDKLSGERPVATAVLRVTVRSALDNARSSGEVIVQDFFEAFLRLIAYADEKGKIRSDVFADIIRDIGDRLVFAMKQSKDGIQLLKNITKFINDPQELFSK